MKQFVRIGVDLAKNYFQVHALTSEGGPAVTRKLKRSKMLEFFSRIAPCRVGMEACGSAHYWARELKAFGHEALLMPPAYTKPYVKRGKNDAADAEAICEAMSRPGMRFVPVKSVEQQATLMLHTTRELLIKQRTMSVNALRSHKGTSNNVRGHKFGLGPVFDCLPGFFFRPLLRLEHFRRLHRLHAAASRSSVTRRRML
jgi:transposase